MNDYERVARIIGFLELNARAQPSLDELARFAGLSPSRLHHLFVRWAGVTPKEFLQCLTVTAARERLAAGASVLDTALTAGLSGPGRLHDLCVSLEAASPGEIKRGGEGLEIRSDIVKTPFGRCLIAETERGICHCAFVEEDGEENAREELTAAWPQARFGRWKNAAEFARQMFSPQAADTPVRLWVRGSEFQVLVWRALLRIPPGHLATYGQVAGAIGRPGSARAVGNAVGANQLACLIPCHRVIRESGVIGHYRWNGTRKRALLGRELSRHRI